MGYLAFQLLQEGHLERVSAEFHGARRDFVLCRTRKAQFADSHGATRSDRGPEGPAGEGPRFVKIASSGCRVERRARFIIVPRLAKHPIRGVAGKVAPQPSGRRAGAGANTRGARRVARLKIRQTEAQALRVQAADLKSPQAALVTPGPALEPGPSFAGGFGQRGIDDLNQLPVVHSLEDIGPGGSIRGASGNKPDSGRVETKERFTQVKFLLWCILLVLCWPLALAALVLYPLVWLLLLPFRLVGIAVEGALSLVWALVTLPARLLRAI